MWIYTSAIRILAKGYLPNTLVTLSKLKEILSEVKTALWTSNPDYDLVIDRLYLYYDMQLVTFSIKKKQESYTITSIHTTVHTTATDTISIRNTTSFHHRSKYKAQSCTHLQVEKPYITLNTETYISIWHQELRTCKRIGYEFYCEELFMVKHKSRYSCESVIYFNLEAETIKENWTYRFYYIKTDITPTVLDDGNEIILANCPKDKHIIWNINNDIPVRIPSHPYVLVNRSVLCNCGIEADNHFLLESLAACENVNSKLTMYFTVNIAFVNYLDKCPNLTESLEFPVIKSKTTFEQTLPIYLNISKFDQTLLTASSDLKEFINSYTNHIEIFDLQERHDNTELITNKNFFSDNYIMDIFMFTSVIISLLAATLTVYLLCKHKKLWILIASMVLHQVKEVGAVTQKEINSECRTLAYIGIILTILGLVMVTILHYRKSKLCKGHKFSNTVRIMLFISDVQNYIPIKLCRAAGSIHLFKIIGMLKAENYIAKQKLHMGYIRNRLERSHSDF